MGRVVDRKVGQLQEDLVAAGVVAVERLAPDTHLQNVEIK